MTTLWLIRHGETDWNVEQRFQGTSDQLLNERGETQAQSLVPRLANIHFDGIYSSDLKRVQRTAELALGGTLEGVTLDSRLQELDFGEWEGLSWHEVREQFPEAFAIWANDREQNPHGGERITDVVQRVDLFLNDLRNRHGKDDHILIFAHGGVLAVMVCMLLETDPSKWWRYRFLNCTLSEIELANRGAILTKLNDDSHLVT